MSLEIWLSKVKSVVPHDPTVAGMQQLFAVVDRDLDDAGKDVSPDNLFSFAYNAALKLCTIALNAEGYETARGTSGHHNTAINSLSLTLGDEQKETVVYLSRCSQKRSQAMYDRVGVVNQRDAKDLEQTARKLRTDVIQWLKRLHPNLVPDGLNE
jgi:hypothetical protein